MSESQNQENLTLLGKYTSLSEVNIIKSYLDSHNIKTFIFDKYANHPDFALRFYLQPDETIILYNRTVLHARTDYEDWPEPDKRRHLLRVWIDAPELMPVAPQHELGDIFEK